MIKKTHINHKKIKKIFGKTDKNKIKELVVFFNTMDDTWSISKKYTRLLIFSDILNTNDSDYDFLYDKYKNSKSVLEKIKIRKGKGASENYTQKLKNRPKVKNPKSTLSISYWTDKGFSIEESKVKISKMQSERSKVRHKKYKKTNKYKSMMPNSILYWTKRGYSIDESEKLREPFVEKSSHKLESYINRHGMIEGTEKYHTGNHKRTLTMMARYGKLVTNGCVSKESLRIFVPLYKQIRKLGIQRQDIYWGINGSKEYANHHEGKNYFFDFTIKSLKYIIEYNNEFWHPAPNRVWKGFYDKDIFLDGYSKKIDSMISRGFVVKTIWNFDDKEEKIQEIVSEIRSKMNV